MNKTELVAAIAEQADISRRDAEAALKAFADVVSERAAREGRNPRTGETMPIKACKSPKFKPGKALKDMVNE